MNPDEKCEHFNQINEEVVATTTQGCEDCLKIGSRWVKLRICLTCGHVGCCDSSVNKHATLHFNDTNHAIMQSFEPGENWLWCYVHEKGFMDETQKRYKVKN